MGLAEKKLYEQYQKKLKEMGIKQLTNEEIEKMLEMVRKGRK